MNTLYSNKNLIELRKEIDEVDNEIINLIEKRFEIIEEVKKLKIKENIPIKHRSREEEIINKNISNLKNKSLSSLIKKIYNEIFSQSINEQMDAVDKFVDKKEKNI